MAATSCFTHDRTYKDNQLSGIVKGAEARGIGVELRIYGCDPDVAEANAKAGGWTVLAGSPRQAPRASRMHDH